MVFVGGLDEQDPICLVEEQDASGDGGTAAIKGVVGHGNNVRARVGHPRPSPQLFSAAR